MQKPASVGWQVCPREQPRPEATSHGRLWPSCAGWQSPSSAAHSRKLPRGPIGGSPAAGFGVRHDGGFPLPRGSQRTSSIRPKSALASAPSLQPARGTWP